MKDSKFQHALKIREDLCEGCSHCMNVCPTEAIRVRNGKAVLIGNRCVDCGKCYRECPSNAIFIDHDDFSHIFDYQKRVALVPAVFSGQFPKEITQKQIFSVILDLGFTHVYEVENGVEILIDEITKYAKKHLTIKPLISSFCPAIIRLIQVKFPSLVDNIMLLKPPLDISAKFVRKQLMDDGANESEIGIFYVTPCAAKIAAIKEPVGELTSDITGVINMDFLYNKVYQQVKLRTKEVCSYPATDPLEIKLRNWSLTNGEASNLEGRCLAIDEIHNVIDFLEKIENNEIKDIDYLELRACDESCAGGVLTHCNRFLTVEKMKKDDNLPVIGNGCSFGDFKPIMVEKEYLSQTINIDAISPRSILVLDQDMGEAMKKMDKVNKMLKILPMTDCSVCGAPTCQALALDIINGEADLEDCVFIQKTLEQNGELNNVESNTIFRKIWGFEKTNKYRSIRP
ncbi:MAG TPA: [Fe-Fe] hydrogenase large subunit C-terminal domain-containing protein [Lentimicrobium sp.]|nr:[Fe-Fe] hydrogenase large subunit C-terminal domain-containing protein [Lentimicrobium sp.]